LILIETTKTAHFSNIQSNDWYKFSSAYVIDALEEYIVDPFLKGRHLGLGLD